MRAQHRPVVVHEHQGLGIEHGGPAELTDLLREYETTLGELGVNTDRVFARGLGEDRVRTELDSIGLVAPDEVIAWYGWHNGMRPIGESDLRRQPPFAVLASLEWSIEHYEYQLSEAVPLGLWAPKWLGLEMGRGISLFCSGSASDLPLVRHEAIDMFDFVETSIEHQVVSLCTVVAWWIEALDVGAVRPANDDGFLTWDYDTSQLMSIDRGTFILC